MTSWSSSEYARLLEAQEQPAAEHEADDRPASMPVKDLAPSLIFTSLTSLLSLVDALPNRTQETLQQLPSLETYFINELEWTTREDASTLGSHARDGETLVKWARARLALVDALARLILRDWRSHERGRGHGHQTSVKARRKAVDIGEDDDQRDALVASLEARLSRLESAGSGQRQAAAPTSFSFGSDPEEKSEPIETSLVVEGQIRALSERVAELEHAQQRRAASGSSRGSAYATRPPLENVSQGKGRDGQDVFVMRLLAVTLSVLVALVAWLVAFDSRR